jgi:hypothetical protein
MLAGKFGSFFCSVYVQPVEALVNAVAKWYDAWDMGENREPRTSVCEARR